MLENFPGQGQHFWSEIWRLRSTPEGLVMMDCGRFLARGPCPYSQGQTDHCIWGQEEILSSWSDWYGLWGDLPSPLVGGVALYPGSPQQTGCLQP